MSVAITQLPLVREGQILFSVHRLPVQRADALLEPADELLQYLERSFGQTVPQMDDGCPVALNLCYDLDAGLAREEFLVEVTAESVTLRAGAISAMFHAVYYFLETALGVRWLWPGPAGEVVPRHRDLALPLGITREAPDYSWRALQVSGAIYGPKMGLDYLSTLHGVLHLPLAYLREFDLWLRRNRFGGLRIADGHRWSEICPPELYGETHPEYFALIDGERDCCPHDGKHGNQPCLANPDVAILMADYLCKRFAAEPALDACSVALNDGGHSCQCAACLALDAQLGGAGIAAIEHFDQVTKEDKTNVAAQPSITDRVFWNLHRVAEQVAARYPERKVLALLYADFRRPPVSLSLPSNVIGQYCVMGHMFWNSQFRDTELERLRAMHASVPELGIYEYYANGAWPEVHRLFPQLVVDSVREYYQAGARYFATQPSTGFAVNGVNQYLLGRALWDTQVSADAVLDDYCEKGFGPAAAPVRRFLTAFAERWRDTESGKTLPRTPEPRLAIAHLYDEAFLHARADDLADARHAAGEDEEIQARIAFLLAGLDYTCRYRAAAQATLLVYETAGGDRLDTASSTPELRAVARQAAEAWRGYWDYVRQRMGTYTFGDYWVNYRPGIFGETDATLAALRRLAGE